ncbi:MAG TPA: hypothetical protein PK677_07665 [Acidiphilium sp.]|nr:hypothetical protein [Acidiphilium sp.]HQU23245.1 hypothetical protein [Acidiphilium sp.]
MSENNDDRLPTSPESVDSGTPAAHEALNQAIGAFDILVAELGETIALDIWRNITSLAPSKLKNTKSRSGRSRGRPKGSRTKPSIQEDLALLEIIAELHRKIALIPSKTNLKTLDRDVPKIRMKQKGIKDGPSATNADIQAADTIRRRYQRLKKEFATIHDKNTKTSRQK